MSLNSNVCISEPHFWSFAPPLVNSVQTKMFVGSDFTYWADFPGKKLDKASTDYFLRRCTQEHQERRVTPHL